MRGLLRKQWYAQRFVLLAALAVLLAGMCYNTVLYLFMEPFAALVIAMLPVFTLNDDAVSHFDRWHVTLPVKRQRYGDSYYLMTALLTVLLLTVHTVIWFRSGLIFRNRIEKSSAKIGIVAMIVPLSDALVREIPLFSQRK